MLALPLAERVRALEARVAVLEARCAPGPVSADGDLPWPLDLCQADFRKHPVQCGKCKNLKYWGNGWCAKCGQIRQPRASRSWYPTPADPAPALAAPERHGPDADHGAGPAQIETINLVSDDDDASQDGADAQWADTRGHTEQVDIPSTDDWVQNHERGPRGWYEDVSDGQWQAWAEW